MVFYDGYDYWGVGVFSTSSNRNRRCGSRIGDFVIDLGFERIFIE